MPQVHTNVCFNLLLAAGFPSVLNSVQSDFQWLELGRKVYSTTDHFLVLLILHGNYLSTMRVDPAGVKMQMYLEEKLVTCGKNLYLHKTGL